MKHQILQTIRSIITMLFVSVIALIVHTPAFAACSSSNSGDLPGWGPTVTLSSCNKTVSATTGVDWVTTEAGTTNTSVLSLNSSTLTINSGGVLAVGSIQMGTGASIAIDILGNGQITIGAPLYIPDADVDGWPATAANAATLTTATASGKRRLALMRGWTVDCGESTYATNNVCCTVATRYQDSDGDGYGNPAVSQSICPTAGWVTDNTDCYDSNANAKPGSTTCSTSNRGDGSFDYNCSGGATYCGAEVYGNQSYAHGWYLSGMYLCPEGGADYAVANREVCGGHGGTCTGTVGFYTSWPCSGWTTRCQTFGSGVWQACQ